MPVRHHHASKLADKLAEQRFTFQQPRPEPATAQGQQHRAADGQREPQPPVRLPWKIKDFRLKHRQCGFRPDGRHQARHQPEQGKFALQRGAQQPFTGPQRAVDHQLLMTLTHADLHLRQQQQ